MIGSFLYPSFVQKAKARTKWSSVSIHGRLRIPYFHSWSSLLFYQMMVFRLLWFAIELDSPFWYLSWWPKVNVSSSQASSPLVTVTSLGCQRTTTPAQNKHCSLCTTFCHYLSREFLLSKHYMYRKQEQSQSNKSGLVQQRSCPTAVKSSWKGEK